jgi:phage shock protein A
MSIFSKASLTVRGNINDLLDKVIDLNSPSAVRQQARDIEAELVHYATDIAVQDGALRGKVREKTELESKIATDLATISKLKASTDANAPQLARDKAKLVLTEQATLASLTSEVANQTQVVAQMNSIKQRLDSQHDQLVQRVHQLESLDRDTKSKEAAAHAISSMGSMLNNTDTHSIDNITQRMQARNDVASAKFDSAVATLPAEDESNSADVDALLASIK